MYKIPLTYTMLDTGEQVTRDFYFNLTKSDILKIHFSLDGGLDGFIERLKSDPDIRSVMDVFEELILKSYGKRTPEGRFIKSKELSQEFAASDAYSELFIKLFNNEDNFVDKFIEGVIGVPADKVNEIIANTSDMKKPAPVAISSEF